MPKQVLIRSKFVLDYAGLCDDCRVVFDMREGDCPACGSSAWLAIGRYIDKDGARPRGKKVSFLVNDNA